jgi:transcription elongation factor
MSFLLDPPLLYAAGRAYGAAAPESAQGAKAVLAGAVTSAMFIGVSAALWMNHPATRPLWKAFGTSSGREYQAFTGLRSWKGQDKAGPREHALAAAGFAAYPFAWWLGWDKARRAR